MQLFKPGERGADIDFFVDLESEVHRHRTESREPTAIRCRACRAFDEEVGHGPMGTKGMYRIYRVAGIRHDRPQLFNCPPEVARREGNSSMIGIREGLDHPPGFVTLPR